MPVKMLRYLFELISSLEIPNFASNSFNRFLKCAFLFLFNNESKAALLAKFKNLWTLHFHTSYARFGTHPPPFRGSQFLHALNP